MARAPRVTEGVAAQMMKMFYGKDIETVPYAISLTLVPRELPPGRSLLVSLSRTEKSTNGCIAVRLFTPYSSTASGPPSLTREGFCKSRFWATDGGAICNRNSLGSSRTSTPTIRKDDRRMHGGNPHISRVVEGADPYRQDRGFHFGNGRKWIL